MGYVIQVFGAYLATVSSGLCLEIPKHLLFKTGFIGALGYAAYLMTLPYTSGPVATLIAGIVIAFLSQIAARLLKSPVTMFYIPSFFPLVPGAGVYKIAYYYIQGNQALAAQNFLESGLIAGAIALSIFLVDSSLEIYSQMTQNKETS